MKQLSEICSLLGVLFRIIVSFQVTLTPNSAWGGEGCLGCDIGYGYLHRIPITEHTDHEHLPMLNANHDNGNVNASPSTAIHVPQPGLPHWFSCSLTCFF